MLIAGTICRSRIFMLALLLALCCGRAFAQVEVYSDARVGGILRYTPCVLLHMSDSSFTDFQSAYSLSRRQGQPISGFGRSADAAHIAVKGMLPTKWVKSFGFGSFTRGNQRGSSWSNVLSKLNGNPYVFADSSIGTYKTEVYSYGGTFASSLSKHWGVGASFGYTAGTGYRTLDPRPYNTFYQLLASLGVRYSGGGSFVGSAFSLGKNAETISVQLFKPYEKAVFFRLLGFGMVDNFRTKESDNESVRYDGGSYQLAFNAGFRYGGADIVAECCFSNASQDQSESGVLVPYEYRLSSSSFRLSAFKRLQQLFVAFESAQGRGVENIYAKVAANSSTSITNYVKVGSAAKYRSSSNGICAGYVLGNATSPFSASPFASVEVGLLRSRYQYANPFQSYSFRVASARVMGGLGASVGCFLLKPSLLFEHRALLRRNVSLAAGSAQAQGVFLNDMELISSSSSSLLASFQASLVRADATFSVVPSFQVCRFSGGLCWFSSVVTLRAVF